MDSLSTRTQSAVGRGSDLTAPVLLIILQISESKPQASLPEPSPSSSLLPNPVNSVKSLPFVGHQLGVVVIKVLDIRTYTAFQASTQGAQKQSDDIPLKMAFENCYNWSLRQSLEAHMLAAFFSSASSFHSFRLTM